MGVLQRYRSKGSKHDLINLYEYGMLKGARYRDDGFVFLPNLISQPDIVGVRDELDGLCRLPRLTFRGLHSVCLRSGPHGR